MTDIQLVDRLLSWPEVRARVPLCRATIYRLRLAGLFPQPVRISPHRVAWRESDIEAWIVARAGVGR